MEYQKLLSYLGIYIDDPYFMIRLRERVAKALKTLGLAAARALCRKLADEATCKSILG